MKSIYIWCWICERSLFRQDDVLSGCLGGWLASCLPAEDVAASLTAVWFFAHLLLQADAEDGVHCGARSGHQRGRPGRTSAHTAASSRLV